MNQKQEGESLNLFPHQVEGTKWMLEREQCSRCPGGLLLDDCGLGKTPQVIHTMLQNPLPLTLIAVPVNLLKQWVNQLHRWAPETKVLMCHTSFHMSPFDFDNEQQLYERLYILGDTAKESKETRSKRRRRRQKKTRKYGTRAGKETTPRATLDFLVRFSKTSSISSCITRDNSPVLYETKTIDEKKKRPLVVVTSYGKLVNTQFEKVRSQLKRLGSLDHTQKFQTGVTIFSKLRWNRIVLDESHVIRNFNTTRTRYVMSLKADIKWCLTATPVHNGIHDYYCLLRFLGLKKWDISLVFGSHPCLEKYLTEEAKKIGRCIDLSEPIVNGKKRKALTHDDLTLRRTKKQVFSTTQEQENGASKKEENQKGNPFLPPLLVQIVEVEFSTPDEQQLYERLSKATVLELQHMSEIIDVNNKEMREQFLFELILRLRQCSVNPALVVNGYKRKFNGRFPTNLLGHHVNVDSLLRRIGVPSKTRVLCEMIKKHYLTEKAIVFCEFREEMAHVQKYLFKNGITSVLYDGTLTSNKREKILKKLSWTMDEMRKIFNHPKFFKGPRIPKEVLRMIQRFCSYDVVLVQIYSGNAGLNLQMCPRVYFTSPNWNPCIEIQAISRAHRCGQTRPVVATKLVLSKGETMKTIDHRILHVQSLKRAVMADILDDPELLENGVSSATNTDLSHLKMSEDDALFLING